MAHRTYTTKSLVLSSENVGDSDKNIYLFTKDLGLVRAHVRNIRGLESKLRFGLQDFSSATVSLVKGKHKWRVTNVLFENNLFFELKDQKEKLLLCKNIFVLLKKLITHEQPDPDLFELVDSGLLFLKDTNLSKQEVFNTETLLVLRILRNLGYVQNIDSLEQFLETHHFTFEALQNLNPQKHKAIKEINRAIQDSHL